MRKLLLFILLSPSAALPAAAYELPSSTGAHRVRFEADEAQYNEYTRVIALSGNVRLEEISEADKALKLIRAKNLSVNMDSRTVISPSDFVIDDDTGIVYGTSGSMNYGAETGQINNGRFVYRDFIFRGRSIEFDHDNYVYKKASITSCDQDPPHFNLRASRMYLVPGSHFLAYNTVFFVRGIPLFYFPVLYKPFGGGTPFVSIFRPGYDQRNGFFMKSSYVFRVNPETRAKAFLDYFGRRGVGLGGEVDFQRPEKNISNASFYRIREYGSEEARWGATGGYWHRFNRFNESDPAQYYSQSYFRLLSDPRVNNDFFRSNPFAVSPDEQASLALTRRTNYTVTRISASGRETRSGDLKSFSKANSSIPRLDFNTVPFRVLRLPVLNSFSGYFENARDAGQFFTQRRGNGVWNVSKSVPLAPRVTLSPSVFYNQSVFISTVSGGTDTWIGRYGGGATLRYDRAWGALDLGYSYTRRLRENKLLADGRAADKGQEASSLSSQLFIMPRFNTYYKLSTAYDLRTYYDASFTRRLAPLTAEIYYAPRPMLDIYVAETYGLSGGTRSFVAQVNVGDKETYVSGGIANYSSAPQAWVLSNTLGFRPWKTSPWRAETVLRLQLLSEGGLNLRDIRFFEKGLTLYRDFHDFRTRWNFKERSGGVREFFFYVTLKFNEPAHKDDLEEKSREFWHPWRQEGEVRD
ncbi:MAG TPA: LPS export ABC transporter periplasmic protein LptC [Elusimicrobiales bacterium]|nr:LPS export ABC transporter periplasmic protein LptC [Elusimicrobiales bacterium]